MKKKFMKSLACSLLFSFMLTIPAEATYNAEDNNNQEQVNTKEEHLIDNADSEENIVDTNDQPPQVPNLDSDSEEITSPDEEQFPDTSEPSNVPDNNGDDTRVDPESKPEEVLPGEKPETNSNPAESEPSLLATSGTWVQDQYGYWYRHSDGSYTTNGWEFIDGYWYYFGSQGYRVTGWQWIDNEWYCFDSSGKMRKGWYTEGGNKYYLDSSSGVMARGWTWIVSEWYYFNSSGIMQKGWYSESGKKYYLDSSTGVMARGWTWIVSEWYYFNSSGVMQTGWFSENNNWYYLDPNSGIMARGWKWIGTAWFYFDSSGVMQTGWLADNGKWYYLNSFGGMVKGWHKTSCQGYYYNRPYWNFFNESGEFVTDSSSEGCSHGYSNFKEHRFTKSLSNLKYYTGCSAMQNGEIDYAINGWNKISYVNITEVTSSNSADIVIVSEKISNPTYSALTALYWNNSWSSSAPGANWSKAQITLSNEYGIRGKETVAHELGHVLGLAHRISDKTSLMYFEGAPSGIVSPRDLDQRVLNHTYGY